MTPEGLCVPLPSSQPGDSTPKAAKLKKTPTPQKAPKPTPKPKKATPKKADTPQKAPKPPTPKTSKK